MARAIDGDELLGIERLLDTDVVRQSKTASWLLDQVLHDIQAMPTLTPPNEPLTFAELREMEGEPVWVEHNNGGEWLVIHWDYVGRITTAYKACLLDHEYGRTWIAYCHPPEGETDE